MQNEGKIDHDFQKRLLAEAYAPIRIKIDYTCKHNFNLQLN